MNTYHNNYAVAGARSENSIIDELAPDLKLERIAAAASNKAPKTNGDMALGSVKMESPPRALVQSPRMKHRSTHRALPRACAVAQPAVSRRDDKHLTEAQSRSPYFDPTSQLN